jgi:hypothetical protein
MRPSCEAIRIGVDTIRLGQICSEQRDSVSGLVRSIAAGNRLGRARPPAARARAEDPTVNYRDRRIAIYTCPSPLSAGWPRRVRPSQAPQRHRCTRGPTGTSVTAGAVGTSAPAAGCHPRSCGTRSPHTAHTPPERTQQPGVCREDRSSWFARLSLMICDAMTAAHGHRSGWPSFAGKGVG